MTGLEEWDSKTHFFVQKNFISNMSWGSRCVLSDKNPRIRVIYEKRFHANGTLIHCLLSYNTRVWHTSRALNSFVSMTKLSIRLNGDQKVSRIGSVSDVWVTRAEAPQLLLSLLWQRVREGIPGHGCDDHLTVIAESFTNSPALWRDLVFSCFRNLVGLACLRRMTSGFYCHFISRCSTI